MCSKKYRLLNLFRIYFEFVWINYVMVCVSYNLFEYVTSWYARKLCFPTVVSSLKFISFKKISKSFKKDHVSGITNLKPRWWGIHVTIIKRASLHQSVKDLTTHTRPNLVKMPDKTTRRQADPSFDKLVQVGHLSLELIPSHLQKQCIDMRGRFRQTANITAVISLSGFVRYQIKMKTSHFQVNFASSI
jgi:hypothetical protein